MNEFKVIPLYPEYSINKLGIVKHIESNNVLREGTYKKVRLYSNDDSLFIPIARLLAITFLQNETCKDLTKLFVYYHDGDKDNISLDNLSLLTRQEFEIRKHLDSKKVLESKYPTNIYTTDGYYPSPWEVKEYPGFYRIPFTDDFTIINKEGKILSLKNGLEKKQHITEKGYYAAGFEISEIRTPFLIHRILGMLFLPIPIHLGNYNYSELEINHKDGNKLNNDLDNLEWVTGKENMDHMYSTGLTSRPKKPVLRRNYITGEITYYESIRDCCKCNLLSKDMMYKHLHSTYAGMIKDGEYVYKLDNKEPWPSIHNAPDDSISLWRKCDVVGKNINTNEIMLFRTLQSACQYLNLNLKTLGNIRHRKGKDQPYNGWIFYPLDRENFKRNK